MERSRLKDIVILILLLVNGFLLASVLLRQSGEQSLRARTEADLSALCEADGIHLDAELPAGSSPAGKVLRRSMEEDRTLAVSVLGSGLSVSDEGGGICACSSDAGQAFFRANGSFDITGHLRSGDAEAFCRKFCKDNGYRDLVFAEDGGSASAVQYCENYPVANALVTFLLENGTLLSVSGTHLPSAASLSPEEGSMTAATALTRFLEARRASGAVVSRISDIYPCYQLQSTTAVPMSLIPAWCIVTDTSVYYVNCLTGEVSHS